MSQPEALVRASLGDRIRRRFFVRPALPEAVAPAAPPAAGRDPRLDLFRGLALVMIFINHVPGNFYEQFTNRNLGFSDAAEAFVFMSGLAAGLAYSGRFATGTLWPAITRVWARARTLYFVHLSITVMALGMFAAAALWFGRPEMLVRNNVDIVLGLPLEAMVGIPLLTHQLGYLNILPLYATLLFFTPLVILAGRRWPLATLLASIALWAAAGQFRLNFPNFPTSGGWFFNPFSWQLIFVIGLLSGMAMKRGESFVPRRTWLFGLALGFLVLVFLWVRVPPLGDLGRQGLGALSRLGLPFYVTWFDKTFLALPRLLHALAVFYVLAWLVPVRTLAASPWLKPLRLMGQQGLAVFAAGTLLSLLLQTARIDMVADPVTDALLLGAGLVLLWALAWVLTRTREISRAAR